MSLVEIEELVASLNPEGRLQMLELLWSAIQKDETESLAWHGEILAQRLAKAEAGNAEFLSIAELKQYLNR